MQTTSSPDHTQQQPPDANLAAVKSAVEKKKTVKDLAAEHTELALERLADILKKGQGGGDDKPASDMAVIAAATALLDRGHGKPMQYIDQTTQIQTLGDLLTTIGQKEQAFQDVVTVEVVPLKALPPPQLSWEDVL